MPLIGQRKTIFEITAAGLLIAIGIIIPMFSPIRIVIEPASYTLASHVAVMLAMFISPKVAVAVALGTTLGFFFGGFPIIIVARAASHVVFALVGGMYLSRVNKLNFKGLRLRIFSLIIAIIHAVCELAVVYVFFFAGFATAEEGAQIFMLSMAGLVGLGTIIHSMIDLEIANIIKIALQKQRNFRELMDNK
jgi:niacin transporter